MSNKAIRDLSHVKAVVLVGGAGTRLRPLTFITPKSLMPVLNRPAMEHMIAYLRQFGIRDIILTLNYLPDAIRNHFGDGAGYGVNLTYCLEDEPLGTAGAVKNASAHLKDTFIVFNGDIFTEIDLAAMYSAHRANGASATIALTWVDDPSAFGVVETDGNLRVKCFVEKPAPGMAKTNWINAGAYVLEPEVLEEIPPRQYFMFERGLFPHLLQIGSPVYGYPYRGYWLDMGTPDRYFALNADLLTARATSPLCESLCSSGIYWGDGTVIHPSVHLEPPVVIGGNCRIGSAVRLTGPLVIGCGCILEEGVALKNAIIWDNVHIGAAARLKDCIIASNVTIAAGQEVSNRVVTPGHIAPLVLSGRATV